MGIKWRLERKKLAELKEYSRNPRALTKKGLADLKQSIEQFGVAEPLVINTDGTICGGHGRKKVLQGMRVKEVDCYVPERELTDLEFKALNIRLNRQAGEFDLDILSTDFDAEELLDLGFTAEELNLEGGEVEEEAEQKPTPIKPIKCPECGHEFLC